MSLTPALKSHFLLLYHMALADSTIDPRELEMLYSLGASKGISRTDIDTLLLQPADADLPLPSSILEKIDYLYDLSLIAWADGTVDAIEKKTLSLFCSRFGFRDENIPDICELLLEAAAQKMPKQELLSLISQNL